MEENERVIRKLKISIERARILAESYSRQTNERPNFGGLTQNTYNSIIDHLKKAEELING